MKHELNWQKSTFSGGGDGNTCVEIAATTTALHLRESESPDTEPTTINAPMAYLIRSVRAGKFE